MKICFIVAAVFAGIGVICCIALGAYWLSGGNCQEIIDYYKAGGVYYDWDSQSYESMPANFTCVGHEFPDGGVTARAWDTTDITCSICQVFEMVGGIGGFDGPAGVQVQKG